MTLRAVRQCPVDPTPVVEEWVDQVELRFRYGASVVHKTNEPLVWMTQRRAARRVPARRGARARGGGSRGRARSRSTRKHGDARSGERFDGRRDRRRRRRERHHRQGGRARRGDRPRRRVRGERPVPDAPRERYARRLVLELADIPGGYAWVFPKGDHANVGVGGWQSEGPKLREHLERACEAHGLEPDELEELRGHRLPLRRPGTRIAAERALLVGDAAGLIDPVSGDGMYECFVSSRLAAAAILDLLAGRASTLRAVRGSRRRRARAAPPRLVEAQAGARPLAAGLLAGRADEAPLGEHPRHARRRAARSRPSSTASRASRCGRSRSSAAAPDGEGSSSAGRAAD